MFDYFVLQIQRCFRGAYSRKYRHDFHKRKEYLHGLVAKGNQIRESMANYSRNQLEVRVYCALYHVAIFIVFNNDNLCLSVFVAGYFVCHIIIIIC